MREIFFRGKRLDNGEWVQGRNIEIVTDSQTKEEEVYIGNSGSECTIFLHSDGKMFFQFEVCQVDAETVGEFTGRIDVHGRKVFEGDIVKARIVSPSSSAYWGVWEVAYHDRYCYSYLKKPNNNLLFDGDWRYGVTKLEVIGNIHDSPELLEVK